MGAVVLAVITAAFLAIVSPELVLNRKNIGQLFFGLIVLIVLLDIYLFQQRLVLFRTRRELIHQLQIAERTARTDALTGIYNRLFMREALTREVARAERSHSSLSIMFADVDRFKDFNTQFGHLTGDLVLMDVATLLKKNFRSSDLVTRYGGDEFLVIMPDTDPAQAAIAVERLAWWVDRWNEGERRAYRVGITCGVATYTAGMNLEQLLSAADKDLYLRKEYRAANKPHSSGGASSIFRV